jgi:hypothetical protein
MTDIFWSLNHIKTLSYSTFECIFYFLIILEYTIIFDTFGRYFAKIHFLAILLPFSALRNDFNPYFPVENFSVYSKVSQIFYSYRSGQAFRRIHSRLICPKDYLNSLVAAKACNRNLTDSIFTLCKRVRKYMIISLIAGKKIVRFRNWQDYSFWAWQERQA